MRPAQAALRFGMRTIGTVAPPLAAEAAYRIWLDLGRPAEVAERDVDIHAQATTGKLLIGGAQVVTYTWGSGPNTVLLVHGWRSRASRFAAVIRTLQSPERTIVSFDAPGNGSSSGTRTTILDYTEAITRLSERHGRFDAIVAHSFGVLATFLAVREGVRTDRIVGISGMYDADQLVDQLALQLSLPSRARRGLRRRIERRAFRDVPDLWERFVSRLDPVDSNISVLLVHDAEDPLVDASNATRIVQAHPGLGRILITHGLGHARTLRDQQALHEVQAFVDDTG